MPSAADIVAGRAAVELVIDRSQLKTGLAAASQDVKKGVAGSTTQLSAPAGAETVVLQKGVADVNAQTVIMKTAFDGAAQSAAKVAANAKPTKDEVRQAAGAARGSLTPAMQASATAASRARNESAAIKSELHQAGNAARGSFQRGLDDAARATRAINQNITMIRAGMVVNQAAVGFQDFAVVLEMTGNWGRALSAAANNAIQLMSLISPWAGAITAAVIAGYQLYSVFSTAASEAKNFQKELENIADTVKRAKADGNPAKEIADEMLTLESQEKTAESIRQKHQARGDAIWKQIQSPEFSEDIIGRDNVEKMVKRAKDEYAKADAAKKERDRIRGELQEKQEQFDEFYQESGVPRLTPEQEKDFNKFQKNREIDKRIEEERKVKQKEEADKAERETKQTQQEADTIRKQVQSPWEKAEEELKRVEELRAGGFLNDNAALHARVKIRRERDEAIQRDAESQPVYWNDDLAKRAMEQGISLQEARNSQARGVKPIVVRADDASMTKEMKERAKAFNGQEFLGEDGSTQVYRYIEKQAEKDQKTIRGTFSGSALGGLGGSADRQLKASEKTAANTAKMLQKLDKVAGPTWA